MEHGTTGMSWEKSAIQKLIHPLAFLLQTFPRLFLIFPEFKLHHIQKESLLEVCFKT
jgi:hypothetical protein